MAISNGGRSYPFTVGSGMPQGCPLSPLTFLLTTEALTRAINSDPEIVGVDLNGSEALKPFWKKLADKIDNKVTQLAPIAQHMSIFGRTNIVNFIIYGSTPRYWMQTLAPPKWFHARIQKAADKILWESPYTGRKYQWVRHPHYPVYNTNSATRTMGTGLLNWTTHVKVKALQAKWILNYLNARKATWKHALDAWFCRTGLGRGAVFSTIPPATLTHSLRGNPALPTFYSGKTH